MRGRFVALGLLTAGLSLTTAGSPARADFQILNTNDPTGNAAGYIPLNQASVNQSLNIGSVAAPIDTDFKPGTAGVLNDPFLIQQFDPTKYTGMGADGKVHDATLYEVVVSLGYSIQNRIQIDFFAPATVTVSAQGMIQLDVNNASGGLAIANIVNPGTFATSKTLSYPTETTNPQFITPTKVVSSTSAMGYFDPATLNTFTGSGTLSLPVVATATSSFMAVGGNAAGGSQTSASAALSVTYYYYFVPEPSSVALTGFGALGLCVVYRVRSRREGNVAA